MSTAVSVSTTQSTLVNPKLFYIVPISHLLRKTQLTKPDYDVPAKALYTAAAEVATETTMPIAPRIKPTMVPLHNQSHVLGGTAFTIDGKARTEIDEKLKKMRARNK